MWSGDEHVVFAAFARPDAAFVIAYDAAKRVERFRVPTPDGSPVVALAASPDGARVIAFTRSRRMLVIDATTGDALLASETPRRVDSATLLQDGSLVIGDDASAFIRYESTDPEALLPRVLATWPASLAKPASVAEARRTIWNAARTIYNAHDIGDEPSDLSIAMNLEPTDESARAMLVEYARRSVANLNGLNSTALGMSLADNPPKPDLERAARMFKLSASLKPQSATLQANYGAALFRLERYDEARAPLQAAIDVRRSRGFAQDAAVYLRLAISAHRCADPGAPAIYADALALLAKEPDDDLETKRLLDEAKHEFGS